MSTPHAPVEEEAARLYAALKAFLERDDLPPGVRASSQQALAAFAQAVNNLGLPYEPLSDLGV